MTSERSGKQDEPASKNSWLRENALTFGTLILTTIVSGVIGFYSGLDAARREVAARTEDHERRLIVVERDVVDLRKREDLEILLHDIIKQQTRSDEQDLIKEIREAVKGSVGKR